jgi:hypothetical protein
MGLFPARSSKPSAPSQEKGKGANAKGANSKGANAKATKVDHATARREFLALKPGRNPKISWDEGGGKVTLKVPRPNNWQVKLINKFFPVPETPKMVALDAIGSHVWVRCDGKNTIANLSNELQREYKLSAKEAELSLQQFFKELGKRGYIGFVTPQKARTSQ